MTNPTTNLITTDFETAYSALADAKGELKLFRHDTTVVMGENPDDKQVVGSLYVLAKKPAEAQKLLIEHLGIKLDEISLTDANLQFLALQRERKDSDHAAGTPGTHSDA